MNSNQQDLERIDLALDQAPVVSGAIDSDVVQGADRALVRLHELLRMPAVGLPSDFSEQVMRRVRSEEFEAAEITGRARSSRPSSWVAAVAGAMLLAAVVWIASPAQGESSIFSTVASALSSTLLAGAGLLSASWSGVGETVGSWFGTSPATGGVLALLFLAFVGIGAFALRRARQRSSN